MPQGPAPVVCKTICGAAKAPRSVFGSFIGKLSVSSLQGAARRGAVQAAFSLAALVLAGCAGPPGGQGVPPGDATAPPPVQIIRPLPAPGDLGQAGAPVPRSDSSRAMQAYFREVETTLKGRGLLRRDIAPSDAPFDAATLAQNFIRIALYDEYATTPLGTLIARTTPSRLRRWDVPVRMSVEFGPSVPAAQRDEDRAMVRAYAGRLARASGHPVSMVRNGGNFTVLIVNEDERRALGPRLEQLVPGISRGTVAAITDLPVSTFCVVFAFSQGAEPRYNRAVAVIRGEHPYALRQSCIHEELAQGMGLANDSPEARPSIFNDDEEFALLTRHDELLLRILYDPRLRPGMTEAEAAPTVRGIAAELMNPGSPPGAAGPDT